MVIAGKRDDHAASGKDFARRGQAEQSLTQRVTPRMKYVLYPSGAPSITSLPNAELRKDRLMERRKLVALSAVFVTVVAALLISSFEGRF